MYAIIEESGRQRRVEAGQEIYIDLHEGGESSTGASITFDRVLLLGEAGGDAASATIGMPYVAGASVQAEVIEPVYKGDKLYIQKFRPKKGYKRRTGHRQKFTKVKITAINAG